MTVSEFAKLLLDPDTKKIEGGWYFNSSGQKGYWANLYRDSVFFWYSVSASDTEVSPGAVAQAIESNKRMVIREGLYFNSGGEEGYEATVKCGEHYYMLGEGKYKRR